MLSRLSEGEVREGERVEGDQEKLFQVVADIDQETVLREMRGDHGGVSDYWQLENLHKFMV